MIKHSISLRLVNLAFLVFLSVQFLACSGDKLATLTARVATEGDTTGTQSTLAVVNFTTVTQNDSVGTLDLTFSNPEGDQMNLVLTAVNGQFPPAVYELDGSSNVLSATFTVIAGGAPRSVEISTSRGDFQLHSVEFETADNQSFSIRSMSADFQFNIDTGGAASGSIGF